MPQRLLFFPADVFRPSDTLLLQLEVPLAETLAAARAARQAGARVILSLGPFQELFRTYWELATPVVSAVNGTTAGLGWMLALLADIVDA